MAQVSREEGSPLTCGEQRQRAKGQERASHQWWGMTPASTPQDPCARWALHLVGEDLVPM